MWRRRVKKRGDDDGEKTGGETRKKEETGVEEREVGVKCYREGVKEEEERGR